MADALRCFVATRITAEAPLRQLLNQLGGMGRAVKPVATENLHLTLKFLARVQLGAVSDIQTLVAQVARETPVCELSLHGLGVFPDRRRPNVLWVGIGGGERLADGAARLDALLEELGFEREQRPFVPHLTIARIKTRPPEAFNTLLDRHSKTEFGCDTIRSIELMQSQLGPEGSSYTVLFSAPLIGGEPPA